MAGLADPLEWEMRYVFIAHLCAEGLHVPAVELLPRNADAQLLSKPVVWGR